MATSLTRSQRILRASIAANTRWSKEDPLANAERAQAGLRAKFEREAREAAPEIAENYRPDAADREYARRAECAYRAHMQKLAFASAKARGRRKASPEIVAASLAKVNDAARAEPESGGIDRIPTTGEPERRAARGQRLAKARARRAGGDSDAA